MFNLSTGPHQTKALPQVDLQRMDKTMPYSNLFNISATFEQVFGPDGLPVFPTDGTKSIHAWTAAGRMSSTKSSGATRKVTILHLSALEQEHL